MAATIVGDVELRASLRAMQLRAQDARPAFRKIGDRLRAHHAMRFATEGYGTWAPLTPAYAARKLKAVGPKPILQLHHQLVDSLISEPMGVEEIGPREATFGTDVRHARFHQEGTRHMVPRPPLDLSEALESEFTRILSDWVTDGAL